GWPRDTAPVEAGISSRRSKRNASGLQEIACSKNPINRDAGQPKRPLAWWKTVDGVFSDTKRPDSSELSTRTSSLNLKLRHLRVQTKEEFNRTTTAIDHIYTVLTNRQEAVHSLTTHNGRLLRLMTQLAAGQLADGKGTTL